MIHVSATLDWNPDQGSTNQASAEEKNGIPNLNPADDDTIDWRSKFRSRRNCEQSLLGDWRGGGRRPKHVLKGRYLPSHPLMPSCILPHTSHSSVGLLQQCMPLLPTFSFSLQLIFLSFLHCCNECAFFYITSFRCYNYFQFKSLK